MWDSKTVVGCCKLVCVLLYSTSTCYEEGLVNFLVDPIVRVCMHTLCVPGTCVFSNNLQDLQDKNPTNKPIYRLDKI